MVKRGRPRLMPGDRVRVPYGSGFANGIVLRTDEVGVMSVTVAIEIEDLDEPVIGGYRPERVEVIHAA